MVKTSICPRLWWLLGLLAVLTVATFPASAASPTEDWYLGHHRRAPDHHPATAARFAFTATLLTGGERVLVAGGYYFDPKAKTTGLIAEMQVFSLTFPGNREMGFLCRPQQQVKNPPQVSYGHPHPGRQASWWREGVILLVPKRPVFRDCELVDETTGEVDHTVQPLHDSRRNHRPLPLQAVKSWWWGANSVDSSGITYLNTAEVYDPNTRSWSKTSDLKYPRSGHTAIRLQDGRVMVVGGFTIVIDPPSPISFPAIKECEIYDPEHPNEGWLVVKALNKARGWHTATLLTKEGPDKGKVLVAGGTTTRQHGKQFGHLRDLRPQ